MSTTKSFDISKQVIWAAYKKVKANKGVAGVDGESACSLTILCSDRKIVDAFCLRPQPKAGHSSAGRPTVPPLFALNF